MPGENNNDDDGSENNESTDQLGQGETLKELRAAAKRSKENADKAAQMERSFAFAKVVGMDKVDHPLVKQLMASYSGDLTDEAVKAHLESMQVTSLLGLGETTTTTTETTDPNAGAGEGQAGDRRATVDSGEPGGEAFAKDPATVGLERAFDLIDKGATREDASTAFFAELFKAAAGGDKRVLTEAKREAAADVGS